MIKDGNKIFKLAEMLWPYNRSLTGKNTYESLKIIKKIIKNLKIIRVKTGTKIFDWKIPLEWLVNRAYIKKLNGEVIVDYKNCNLHLITHSSPLKKKNNKINRLKKKTFL